MRILSGIQPTGTLHLGNYFGMMRPAVELQERGDAFYFIADLHALTTVRENLDFVFACAYRFWEAAEAEI